MVRTFLYLSARGLINRLRVRLRRIREPRYLVGSIVGLFYLYSVFLRRYIQGGPGTGPTLQRLQPFMPDLTLAAAVALMIVVALSWVWPSSQTGIAFTRAEVQFFFPAPIARRDLLHYKLLRSMLATVFGSAILAVVFRPGTLATAWMFLTGMWLTFALLSLHFTGMSLSRGSVAQHGASGLRRQWVPLVIVAGGAAILVGTLASDAGRLSSLATGREVLVELGRLASSGAARWVLWPFLAVVRVPLATSTSAYWHALPVALGLIVLNYVWVIRSDAAFEEASADRSERMAARAVDRRPIRASAGRAPFTLSGVGRPEIAILWKNLILLGRYASVRTLVRVAASLVILGIIISRNDSGVSDAVAAVGIALTLMTVLFGPQVMRNDLRQDLARLSVLKTWPIDGAALLRGEILAPAAVLTALAVVVMGVTAAVIDRVTGPMTAAQRMSDLLAALVLAPALILVQLVIQNGLAVMFPAWITIGASRARGFDVMGQRLITMAGIWLALIISLLPAVVVAGVIAIACQWSLGFWPVLVPALAASGVLLVEVFLATMAIGRVLDGTDVGAVDAAE